MKKRIKHLIHRSIPKEIPPLLSEQQVEKLKTAGAVALAIVGVAGVLALSVAAPNAFLAIDKLFFRKNKYRQWSHKEKEQKVVRTFYYLKEHGYIRLKPVKDDLKVFLTALGKRKLQQLNLETMTIAARKDRKWDNKWWLVAADIPTEDYKWAADLFRQKLKDMKFFSLQRTLWLFPFDPSNEIDYLLRYYGIAGFVTVMEVNRLDMDDERAMMRFFRKEKIL